MYRLLLLALTLPFFGVAEAGRATRTEANIDIVAVDRAGHQTNLTHDPGLDISPAVARDGRIVFVSTRDQGIADLYVMDGDGGNVRRLTNGSADHSGVAAGEDLEFTQPSWSPRGDKIAFDGKYGTGGPSCEQYCVSWDVLVIGSDGSGLRQIALNARAPAWSRDSRRLAYESGIDAYFEAGSVTVARLDGTGSVRLKARNYPSDVGPAWSPSRNELAFQALATDGGPTAIYVVRGDGRGKRRLAAGHDPVWSPDGRRLAFIQDYRLLTSDGNGNGTQRLSRKGEFVVGAAWSPKGDTLAYVAGTTVGRYGGAPRNLRLELVGADGKKVRVLAREPADMSVWGDPVWTPNGKRILIAVG